SPDWFSAWSGSPCPSSCSPRSSASADTSRRSGPPSGRRREASDSFGEAPSRRPRRRCRLSASLVRVTLDEQGIPTAPLGSRYRLDRRIGSGGMAEVFAATDLVLERTVAVKRLSRALVDDAVARRRLQREARALASTHDPNIVAVFDVGE